MTPGFHERRAKFLFNRQGLKPRFIRTEDALRIRRPAFADAYVNSELYQKEKKRENRIYWVQRIPFMADIMTKITKKTRGIVYTKDNAGKNSATAKPATSGAH